MPCPHGIRHPIIPPEIRSHTVFEDAQAIFTGALFVSLALLLFGECGLLTGGTAGAAFVLHYATGISLGKLFFALNIPSTYSPGNAWAASSRSRPSSRSRCCRR